MRKNRFCTFTLISALMIAALPSTLAVAGNDPVTVSSSVQSLPEQKSATLTITPSGSATGYNPDGSKFDAYQVMSLSQTNGTDWTWTMVNGFTYPGEGDFEPDELHTYPAAKMQDLADRLALQADPAMQYRLGEKAISQGSCSWTTERLGIYLVCETETKSGNFPSAPFLVSLPYTNEDGSTWNYNALAHPKGSEVGLKKQITGAKGSYNNTATYNGDKDTVAIGDTVSYEITTRVPKYTEIYFNGKNPTFKLTDTIARGLSLKADSISLKAGDTVLTKDTHYTQTITASEGQPTELVISLTSAYLKSEDSYYKELSLTYDVDVNDNASLSDDGNENVVVLNYSYDPEDPTDTKEVDDDATVYTFGIQIEKFDGDKDGQTKEKLAGAQFALYKEVQNGSVADALGQEACRPVGVTDENGALSFKGLDAGTYYLKEVKAPSGYSLLTKPIKVQIIPKATQDTNGAEVITDGSFTATVNGETVTAGTTEGNSRILVQENREGTVIVSAANHKGFSLPMTGGRGIVLILIIAASGLMAVTVFFMKGEKRKAASGNSHQS